MRIVKKVLAILIFFGMLLAACGRGGPACPLYPAPAPADLTPAQGAGDGNNGQNNQMCQTHVAK